MFSPYVLLLVFHVGINGTAVQIEMQNRAVCVARMNSMKPLKMVEAAFCIERTGNVDKEAQQ